MPEFTQKRQLEMDRGREVSRDRAARAGQIKQFQGFVKEADARFADDEVRRKGIIETPETESDRVQRHIAASSVQDAAQTTFEAILHLANREEPVSTHLRLRKVEELDDPTVDTAAAQEATRRDILAQALNQPTILANEQGKETEDQPLNVSLFHDDELSMGRVVLPPDRLTPKTPDQAEQKADAAPDPEKVVGDGKVWNPQYPETEEAPEIFDQADEFVMPFPVPGDVDKRLEDEPENTPVAKRRGRPPGKK